ncbi:hypothetical protein ACKVWC_009245 [Pyricularia oryzae]|uniref:Uncharacterized protein n=1 Tax=Pyricularia grisea TaxID=148305 RepID=A0ABQ8NRR4_PYRGI|nr:hypothetical protein MCOR33_003406 [Pyricularia grisea]KAI6388693.1 hypothetical protein MCOR32_000101 [Pyricularia oryzae]KAI6471721.1 hypothetical protein MCOR15_000855 [Pyricularia oryzae]KAI6534711.1 hypothetical protein MCOR16_003034 [Pyricularia oryzae]KAI6556537.1 hypothetical protein MCOR03_006265 [Pyricularia oryzae]
MKLSVFFTALLASSTVALSVPLFQRSTPPPTVQPATSRPEVDPNFGRPTDPFGKPTHEKRDTNDDDDDDEPVARKRSSEMFPGNRRASKRDAGLISGLPFGPIGSDKVDDAPAASK